MPDAADPADLAVLESETSPADSAEYDFSMTATATVTGPRGTIRIDRRYHARPRHNDVVDTEGVDSNDELLDRADELYAHSKFYAVTDDGDDYVLDRHETWQPTDPAALSDESAFADACEAHHLAALSADYAAATAERERSSSDAD